MNILSYYSFNFYYLQELKANSLLVLEPVDVKMVTTGWTGLKSVTPVLIMESRVTTSL